MPSFELWLLLHYENIQAPIHRDEVMHRLRQYIQGYEKGLGGIFATTRSQLDTASAERMLWQKNSMLTPLPSRTRPLLIS